MDNNAICSLAQDYIKQEQDPHFKAEVETLLKAEDWKELEYRFYRRLEFGTGGLRGVIGGGFNRMNTFVVKSATQGLANYVKKAFTDKARAGTLSAAIAFDSRHYSDTFAQAAALVFAGNGIKAYLFSSLAPTPELSFAIRYLGCDTGIVITASHNPKQYNGYKAYWNDGSQVIPPHDTGIIDEVNAVTVINELSRQEALDKGLLKIIDREVDEPYQSMVRSKLFRPDLIKAKAHEVKIVYTPLHGTGAFHVESVLGSLGLPVITVPEQREGNGDFPTVAFPNPEEAPALDMAIKLAKQEGADLVMATDPDADRFGIALPDEKGDFTLVTGNQLGTLLADYIFLSRKENGTLPQKPALINSIVTTGMQKKLAEYYGASCIECLTGFKWIAAIWRESERSNDGVTVVFGTEESYGFLIEPEVRDKDGVSAAALTAEMTLYWRSKGKTLLQRLDELYLITGYWQEMGISKYFPGIEGPSLMARIMASYRNEPPGTLGGIRIEKIRDLSGSVWKYPDEPERTEPVDLPKSDVLQFYLTDGTVVSIRPSGTEPKIKFYASCCTPVGTDGLLAAKDRAAQKLTAIRNDIRAVIGE
ncbi:MAG: phospho-sugar mutase [Spirochaetaceae bacterium]|jgi:phosphoglucomutase|nr:phospho-sugar mutase [Spirochaetaceae bacterium]